MNKLEELAALKARVAVLEVEVLPETQSRIDALATEIDAKFTELTALAKGAKLNPTVCIADNSITFDGSDWVPTYGSDWYSSSANC